MGHLCKKRELNVMLVVEDEAEILAETWPVSGDFSDVTLVEPPFPIGVSLNSVIGIDNQKQ